MKITDYKVLETKRDGVHWGWFVAWLLLFYPALLLVALIHFNSKNMHLVIVKYEDGSVSESEWMSQEEFNKLQLEIVDGWVK